MEVIIPRQKSTTKNLKKPRRHSGQIKPGQILNPHGRKKGEKDWRTKRYDLMEVLERKGFDPIEAMVEMAMDTCTEKAIRQRAIKDILDRVLPPLTKVEYGIDENTLENLVKFKQQMLELMASNTREY
jgi:hypothetical protein